MEAIATLNRHVSMRRYTDRPVDDDTLHTLLEAARRAPTSSNLQAYSLLVVRDAATKAQLAHLAGDQRWVAEAPVFVAICADISRLAAAANMHGAALARNTELTLVAAIDAALVGMSACLAAESLGLGTVMIGGIRNHVVEAAQLLGLPQGAFIAFGLCIGWPDDSQRPPLKPRLPAELVVHHERYQAGDLAPALAAYDAALAAHYRGEGRGSPDDAWTGVIARGFSTPRRPELRAALETLGFDFS
jgi:FMN reductase (NADPH)